MDHRYIKLRREVFKSDAWKILGWLEDKLITRYLNEQQNVCKSIRDIINRINMPILTHLFNQDGTFFMIMEDNREPIGFLRLIPKRHSAEMVIVIGDREKWGQGFGTSAIIQGLKHAFFKWRSDEVIAKINLKNQRSRKVFKKVGFTKDKELNKEIQYSMSIDKFLKLAS